VELNIQILSEFFFFVAEGGTIAHWTMLQSFSLCPALLTSKNDTADKGGNNITPISYGCMYIREKKRVKSTWALGNKMELS
jgi:hypothetical protein